MARHSVRNVLYGFKSLAAALSGTGAGSELRPFVRHKVDDRHLPALLNGGHSDQGDDGKGDTAIRYLLEVLFGDVDHSVDVGEAQALTGRLHLPMQRVHHDIRA